MTGPEPAPLAHLAPPGPRGGPVVAGRTVLLGMLAVGLVLVLIAAIFVIRTVGFGHRHHNPVDPPAPAASAGAPGGYTSGW